MVNTLDGVVKSHTRKAAAALMPSGRIPKARSALERAGKQGKAIKALEETSHLDARYPKFDPAAMLMTYRDEKLELTLPALFAFGLEDELPSRRVRFTHLDDSIIFYSTEPVGEGETARNKPNDDPAGALNLRTRPIWETAVQHLPFQKRRRVKGVYQVAAVGGILLSTVLLAYTASFWIAALLVAIILSLFAGFGPGTSSPLETTQFTATFDGLIPDKVHAKIDAARGDFDSILLLCDVAGAWTMEQKVIPLPPDPLVLGVKRVGTESFYYLIDQFNLTKLEDLVAAEWTTAPSSAS
jgi:hypothetical protein